MKGWGEDAVEGLAPDTPPRAVARQALARFPAHIRRSRKHREARHRLTRQALTAFFRARESRNAGAK